MIEQALRNQHDISQHDLVADQKLLVEDREHALAAARKAAVPPKQRLKERRARRERYRQNKSKRLADARAESLADIGYAKWKALGSLLSVKAEDDES